MRHQQLIAFDFSHGAPCPYCGGKTLCPTPQQLTRAIELTERQETLIIAGWQFAGRPECNGFALPRKDLFEELFDDADGGPEPEAMYRGLREEFASLIPLVEIYGMYFSLQSRKGLTLRLTPDPRVSPVLRDRQSMPGAIWHQPLPPMPCPCCSRHIARPTMEMTMHRCQLQPSQRKWVRAVAGYASGLTNEGIVANRYGGEDLDISLDKQIRNMTEAFCEINKALRDRGAGFWIENLGYRNGYKISYGVKP